MASDSSSNHKRKTKDLVIYKGKSLSNSETEGIYHDVMFSYDEDTRETFVDRLDFALKVRDIRTNIYDKRCFGWVAERFNERVEKSKLSIIVLSKTYVSSLRCLSWLVKIMKRHRTKKTTAYPLFYDVDPYEVPHQIGKVGLDFAYSVDGMQVRKWREALEEAADLSHWKSMINPHRHEAKLIQNIAEHISFKLRSLSSQVSGVRDPISIQLPMKDLWFCLKMGLDDVRMIGFKGMGGAGKTTLARAVFDSISIQFEGTSFVENVREVSRSSLSGLQLLQKKILSDVLNDHDINITSVHDGKSMLEMSLLDKKILIVLDDVDHIDQLEALAGKLNWFGAGSRIIITTSDGDLLLRHQVKWIHDVRPLSIRDAICLFSWYAFGKVTPTQGYEKLSEIIVYRATALPLMMRVLGSFFCNKNMREWMEAVRRLTTIQDKGILEKLELSYMGLEEDYKEIFLDVACLLKGWPKDDAIRILESCGFHARNGLRALQQKSLLTISESGCLGMHDLIEEMGRNIVRRVHPDKTNKHSRLWIQEEIEDILGNDLGTDATRAIVLHNPVNLDSQIVTKGLGNMNRLRLLCVASEIHDECKVKIDQVSQNLPNALQFMSWVGYPHWSLPETFGANNLVALEMPYSRIEQLWEGRQTKALEKLKFLNLSHSNLRVLDLRLAPNLETLNLEECHDLVELDMPADCVNLRLLKLSHSKLQIFNITVAPYIETISLEECHDLVEFHMPSESHKLTSLKLSHSKLVSLDLTRTPNLKKLDLQDCYHLEEIHTPIGCLKSLVFVNLSGCSSIKSLVFIKWLESLEALCLNQLYLKEFPDIIPREYNSSLLELRLRYNDIEELPSSILNLRNLVYLDLHSCRNLKRLPESIGSLRRLRNLKLYGCIIEHLPNDICFLECLEKLNLSFATIKHLPSRIDRLKKLKTLNLSSCWSLEELPEDIGQLICLQNLILTECTKLRDIPDSICQAKHLKYFSLLDCILLEKLPEELGLLSSLEVLNIKGTVIRQLPRSISLLKGLKIYGPKSGLRMHGYASSSGTLEDFSIKKQRIDPRISPPREQP